MKPLNKKTPLLVALLLSAALSAYAQQQADPEGNFTFRIIDNGRAVEITGHRVNNTDVRIPDRIQNLPVTVIGFDAFRGGEFVEGAFIMGNQLTSVIIPNSVTHIGEAAFAVNQLTSVIIPNSVTYIDESAFSNNQLTSVSIPDSVTYIGEFAFSSNQLTNISIGNSVTQIGGFAFSENQLASVNIPNSVMHISAGAFADNQLSSVSIPDSVTHIGNEAFLNNQLTNVSVPSVASIHSNAFDQQVTITRR